ncbi:MAG: MotA/TolQ/ExbB proton channel family protein [Bacteroidales bacterium]|nr:MotA/TolQ/ExbB proton channel family protein [Bacteroidales bacterium]
METQVSLSIFQLAVKGGFLMIVLLALSILAFYIFGKRYWSLRLASKGNKAMLKDVISLASAGKYDLAKELCGKSGLPQFKLVKTALEHKDLPRTELRAVIEDEANALVAKYEQGLPTLATISGGAPMIGFLGTVIGMIKAFMDMASHGANVDITHLSNGIYTAMVTTVGGLVVGIIAYFAYNWLTSKVDDLAAQLESVSRRMTDLLAQ